MINLNLGKKLGFAALLAFSATSANALVLDSFNYDNDAFSINNIAGLGVLHVDKIRATTLNKNTSLVSDPNVNSFGSDVNYKVSQSNNGFAISTAVAGVLDVSNASTGSSEIEILYGDLTAATATNGVIVNNTPLDFAVFGDAFYYDLLTLDVGTTAADDLDVTITVFDGVNYSSVELTFQERINELTRKTVAFSEFSGADFSNIVSVTMVLNAANGVDFQLDEIGVFSLVPEPTTLAIFGLGLIGFAASRKRKA